MEIKYLQVLVMPNGELLCLGKTLGFKDSKIPHEMKTLGSYLFTKEEVSKQK